MTDKTPQDAVLELLAYRLTEIKQDQQDSVVAQQSQHAENRASLAKIEAKLDATLVTLQAQAIAAAVQANDIKQLQSWRSGSVVALVGLGVAMFRNKFGF